MPDQYYDSTLTGQQLDAAFLQMQNIQQTATQVQSNATAAAQSASQAASSASAASASASQASTSAGQAAESAADASGQADAAAESARQAAASAASIEGDVEQAASSASAAAQSATQASGSASAAAQSASAAADSEDSVQQNAAAAQQAAAAASQSKSDAEAAASNAASSASTAQQAASLIEENLSAIQAAPSNAQAAQQAAAQAAASASAAEEAAERAEQIADFDPADFATAEQGAKADSAVQSVNGVKPDGSGNVVLDITTGTVRSVNGNEPDGEGNVQLDAGDVGAATAAQGALAETAVQPAALESYALKSELPTTPADIGAATAAQGAKADTAVQPADLNGYAQTSDIPTELPNPQSLGIRLGSAGSLIAYDGSIARMITITPEAIGAQPAGASSGGELTLLYYNTSVTTLNPGESIIFNAAGYDAIGIVSRHRASDDFYSPMQIVEFNSEPYTTCVLYAVGMTSSYGPEISAREVSVASGAIIAQDRGQYYNWGNHAADDGACIPVQVWGIKF